MMHHRYSMQRQQGYLMIVAVFFILVIAVMGMLIAYTLAVRAPISAAQQSGFRALYMAESGLEIGARLLSMPNISGTPSRLACASLTGNAQVTNASLAYGSFTLTTINSSPVYGVTSLSGGISAAATSLTLSSSSSFAPSGRVVIDGELMNYTGISGNTLTNVRRGAAGTLASAHAGGAAVSQYQCSIDSRAGIPSIASPSYQRELSWNIQLQDAWAVGDRQGNSLKHFNWNRLAELDWSASSISGNKNTRANLNAVSMLSDADGWAVGDEVNNDFTITHWTGGSWSRTALSGACSNQDLYGISMVSVAQGFAVGARYRAACAGSGNYRYTLLYWNGSSWSLLTPSTSPSIPADAAANQNLNAVHVRDTVGSGAGNIGFAVGDSGTILQFNGSSWTAATSPVSQDLKGVFVVSSSEAWAVGASGTILRWNGSSWSTVSSPTTSQLNAIYMLDTTGNGAADSGFAVGASGTIIRYNGASWSSLSSGTNKDLYGTALFNASDAWAVGDTGTTLHWNGSSWSSIHSSAVSGTVRGISPIATGSSPVSVWRQTFH